MTSIPESQGRVLFGHNAAGYAAVRPPYPDWMFDLLVSQGALYPGAATLEIGAGSGLATRALIAAGAGPLTLIEPDPRFRQMLQALPETPAGSPRVHCEAFENVSLPAASVDLILVATTFHWLEPGTRVGRIHRLLKPGGYAALIWNVFQDLNLTDPFHEATYPVLKELLPSPSGAPDQLPFALDRAAREKEFLAQRRFRLVAYAENHWHLQLNPRQVRQLYEGFSSIAQLDADPRADLLDSLEAIARTEFAGNVTRNMTSPLYLFQRL